MYTAAKKSEQILSIKKLQLHLIALKITPELHWKEITPKLHWKEIKTLLLPAQYGAVQIKFESMKSEEKSKFFSLQK